LKNKLEKNQGSNEKKRQAKEIIAPPKLALLLLSWCLPASVKDYIIGDLYEEFNEQEHSQRKSVLLWFWKQTIDTCLLYMWKEKGGFMAFLVSILLFGALTIMAMLLGGELRFFWDFYSFVLVVPPAIVFGIASSSISASKESIALAFTDQLAPDAKSLLGASQFLSVAGNTAVYAGIFTTLIGWVAIAANIKAEEFSQSFGPAFAVSILTLMYGVGFKLICYTAEKKIQFRYSSN